MNLSAGTDRDFHRAVKNPGAYEWWHFDGRDARSGYGFSIEFSAGNLFSPYYQDSLKTYWEKTKSPLVDPGVSGGAPRPLDHCGVAFRLFHGDRMVAEGLHEFPGKFFRASDTQGAVLLGPNRFNWDPSGDPPSYVVTAQAPLKGGRKLLRARLFFTPLIRDFPPFPPPAVPSTHHWILAAPFCHVEGTLQWCDAEGETEREIPFVGKGFHDHHAGAVPLDRFVRSWHWGRALWEDAALVYSVQVPAGERGGAEGVLFSFRGGRAAVERAPFRLSGRRRNFFWLPYAKRLQPEGNLSPRIRHRRILGDGPVCLVFEDDILWETGGKTLRGTGLSTYVHAPRLSSRFFFPMLKARTTLYAEGPLREGSPGPPPGPGDVSTTRPPL
jgi:hypothetical protein